MKVVQRQNSANATFQQLRPMNVFPTMANLCSGFEFDHQNLLKTKSHHSEI